MRGDTRCLTAQRRGAQGEQVKERGEGLREAVARAESAQQGAGHHDALNLIRAFVDLGGRRAGPGCSPRE